MVATGRSFSTLRSPLHFMCLLLLLLMVFISLSSTKGISIGHAQRRHRRSIGQFGDMIRIVTQREALLYNNYGNHCGLQGGSQPVVDEVDRCCRSHDRCYEAASARPCSSSWLGPSLTRYSWTWNGTHLLCGEENDACAMATCECDAVAATCFAMHPWKPEHKKSSIWDILA